MNLITYKFQECRDPEAKTFEKKISLDTRLYKKRNLVNKIDILDVRKQGDGAPWLKALEGKDTYEKVEEETDWVLYHQ